MCTCIWDGELDRCVYVHVFLRGVREWDAQETVCVFIRERQRGEEIERAGTDSHRFARRQLL